MKSKYLIHICISCMMPQAWGSEIIKTDTVRMFSDYFEPAILNIQPNTEVVWINEDLTLHTTTSGSDCVYDRKWDSGLLHPNETFSIVFTLPGEFPYYCIPHCQREMTGVVLVGDAEKAVVDPEKKKKRQFSIIPG